MPSTVERSIFRRAALCGALVVTSFVIPRFVPNSEGGFGAATSAALVFLAILCAAGVVGLVLLITTINKYREISALARIAGIAPGILIVSGLIGLWVFLRY